MSGPGTEIVQRANDIALIIRPDVSRVDAAFQRMRDFFERRQVAANDAALQVYQRRARMHAAYHRRQLARRRRR